MGPAYGGLPSPGGESLGAGHRCTTPGALGWIWFPGLNLIYLPKCPVQIPDLPPPQIDRVLDSCSPDHGVVLCMISCWFSRHCFSLSSVSVSRCSKMETVCKINVQAQDGGAPGLPSTRPAQLPRNKRHLFPPRLLLGALSLGLHVCSCWFGKVLL